MIIKIIWTLICINAVALLFVFGMFAAGTSGRQVDYMEKGWMTILFILAAIVILLAAVPLWISHSNKSVLIAAFFAVLPMAIAATIFLRQKFPVSRKEQSLAEFYFSGREPRRIAAAIEHNDSLLVANLLAGEDINKPGNRVWDGNGLTYLEFAIRLNRDNGAIPVQEAANRSIIRTLVENGAVTTPALREAAICLPSEMISLLLQHGADPNTHGFVSSNPLLFEMITTSKQKNDIAILLIQKGADVNALNDYRQSPLMHAAQNAGTSALWSDTWRLVRFMLEDAHANYNYTREDGVNFASIVGNIKKDALDNRIRMPDDFNTIVSWLKQHNAQTSVSN
jgi:hypothetical protein